MLCGAAGGRELFLTILTIWVLMFAGTIIFLVSSIVGGDFRETHVRARPIEAEEEALAEEAGRHV
jgi:hypothetical protein